MAYLKSPAIKPTEPISAPSALAEAFKRSGRFDALRVQMLASFQQSVSMRPTVSQAPTSCC